MPLVHREVRGHEGLQLPGEGYQSLSQGGMDYIHMYSHIAPLTGSKTAATDFRVPRDECSMQIL